MQTVLPSICKTNDEFAFSLVTMHVPKVFPLKPKYDKVLLALLRAGLVNLLVGALEVNGLSGGVRKFSSPPGEFIVLTLKHLQSAFYFLLIGYAISVLLLFI